ncbi:MAG: RNA polymerase sigma-54 factor [Candidatus Glassbacteria bacterium GWA2_58_10]|uniref:RNA polymerase sigma-54 factor n=1 Tax=Candidatus Glassbacteria bacterium GWA2_58_10 TaxID=1817865 RepID=A0A1F5YA54_9BACT|nr:MAG: RNA polymerase sigma-54 factor [Candidatus Glassbacteria bacterium GWA2_58_10]
MALHNRMELQYRQELTINPRLYQAMDLLQMPLLDLQMHLKQELLINPFLELAEEAEENLETAEEEQTEADEVAGEEAVELPLEEEEPRAEEVEPEPVESEDIQGGSAEEATLDEAPEDGDLTTKTQDDIDWDKILNEGEFDYDNFAQEVEDREFYERAPINGRSLYEYLTEQLVLLKLDDRQLRIGEEIIGDISDDGYLTSSVSEIAFRLREEETAVEEVLKLIQTLDPLGVGARDLKECLLIQLRDTAEEDELVYKLVDEYFEQLSKRHWQEIARETGLSLKEIQNAADQIAHLEPKPGRLYNSSKEDNYVIPDLIVEKVEGEYGVYINDSNLPRLRLSRAYQDIARNRKSFTGEAKDFIYNKLNSANWLIQAIEQRKQTMLKVMRYIVDKQHDFLEHGISHLKPLTLREVSEAINMHESTISRVTNDKYCQTPRGVFQLKFFFSVGLASDTGEDVSARGIKDKISKMIEAEEPSKPLTDQEIVARLKVDGLQIARRTVAKYRDQMGILPARMRKRV